MSKDDVKITEEVHVEVTPAHDPFKSHKKSAPTKKTVANAIEQVVKQDAELLERLDVPDEGDGLVAIGEAAWTAQDIQEGLLVIDRHEEWPTQDYVANPPAPVLFERPHDSI